MKKTLFSLGLAAAALFSSTEAYAGGQRSHRDHGRSSRHEARYERWERPVHRHVAWGYAPARPVRVIERQVVVQPQRCARPGVIAVLPHVSVVLRF